MDKIETKRVPFMDAELIAIRDQSGQIWAGVKWICTGIGFNKSLADNQIQKMQNDKLLKRGSQKFPAGIFDPRKETLAVKLEYIPIWLAKINITSKMEQEVPELVEKLFRYQLEAKDVLANAFLARSTTPDYESLSPELRLLINMELKQKEQDRAIEQMNQKIDGLRDIISLSADSWRTDARKLIVRIAQAMGGNDHIKDVNREVFRLVDVRAGVSLSTRLTNKRRRMAEEGTCKSARDKLNNVDVIADDKKLIEIYIAVIKEMAVKYGINLQSST